MSTCTWCPTCSRLTGYTPADLTIIQDLSDTASEGSVGSGGSFIGFFRTTITLAVRSRYILLSGSTMGNRGHAVRQHTVRNKGQAFVTSWAGKAVLSLCTMSYS